MPDGTRIGPERAARDSTAMGDDDEPDYRFTLANERTFLAWVRTALGLLAGGVALSRFRPEDGAAGTVSVAVELACLGLSCVLAVGALRRWRDVQRAIVVDAPLPPAHLVPVVAIGVVVLATAAAVLLALS